ncbi:hypothetical protein K435DRAFT_789070 [Dendrothele bispora CBS 962.96]|uniref:Nephrocystin 3-like N-terminal domain-containing protein n=1 Tax=Dendrothele bispora (strain CBS 962.96) TaxID=1314807 RepID=A0A4S8MV81_DENBC|nr:hypothetical protein K435DRAFT_789070 [Dendrothele bispora CBS 962.96]
MTSPEPYTVNVQPRNSTSLALVPRLRPSWKLASAVQGLQTTNHSRRKRIPFVRNRDHEQKCDPIPNLTMAELWTVFAQVTGHIPLLEIQAMVGVVIEIKSRVDKDLVKDLEGLRQLEQRLNHFNSTVNEGGFRKHFDGSKQLDFELEQETVAVFMSRCVQALGTEIKDHQTFYGLSTKEEFLDNFFMKSGNYVQIIGDIITHMTEMLQTIVFGLSSSKYKKILKETSIDWCHKANLTDSIPHVSAALDEGPGWSLSNWGGTYINVIEPVVPWEDKSIFWLYGDAPLPRSVMLDSLLKTLSANFTVRFHCGRAARPYYANPRMILPTLAWRLQQMHPTYRRRLAFRLKYTISQKEFASIRDWRPKQQLREFLVEPFKAIAGRKLEGQRVVFVVDSLEECFFDDSFESLDLIGELISEIQGLIEANDFPEFKFIIASRDDERIKAYLDEIKHRYEKSIQFFDMSTANREDGESLGTNASLTRSIYDISDHFLQVFGKVLKEHHESALSELVKPDQEILQKAICTIMLLKKDLFVPDLSSIIGCDPTVLQSAFNRRQLRLEVALVQNPLIAKYIRERKIPLGFKPPELSILECELAANLLKLLNKELIPRPDTYRAQTGTVRGEVIGYACTHWWFHLRNSYTAHLPDSQEDIAFLFQCQNDVIRELKQLLSRERRRLWIGVLENELRRDDFKAERLSIREISILAVDSTKTFLKSVKSHSQGIFDNILQSLAPVAEHLGWPGSIVQKPENIESVRKEALQLAEEYLVDIMLENYKEK